LNTFLISISHEELMMFCIYDFPNKIKRTKSLL
jgi:hypothetical protein